MKTFLTALIILLACLTTLHAQNLPYANLIWKDVNDGGLVGLKCLQVLDLNDDGQQDIIASGHLSWDIEHFFIYEFKNGEYVKKWNSSLYYKGINAITTFKSDIDGHNKICVLSDYNQVEIYDGVTLAVKEKFTLPFGEVIEVLIDNVDDTPDKELIVIGKTGLKVFSMATKQLKWLAEDIKGFNLKIGDIDNDGKKEIITATKGWELPAKLNVVSAYTKTVKWSLSDKQFYNVYLFDVDADGYLDIVGSVRNEIIYINSQTQRSITLVSSNDGDFSGIYYVGDIDKDNRPEILVGTYGGGVKGYYFNGTQMWALAGHDYSVNRFVVGDVDKDGEMEVIRGTSGGSNGDMHLYINDFKTQTLEFGNTINNGYSTFGISDIDNDNNLDWVVCNTIYKAPIDNFANRSKGQIRNFNLSNRQKSKTTILPFNSLDQLPLKTIGQSRDKTKREIAFDFGIFDALTHQTLLDASDYPLWGRFNPIKFADIDNDGIDELLSYNSIGSKIEAYRYKQGAYVVDWELSLPSDIYVNDILVKDTDSDISKEMIILHRGKSITVFDIASKNLEWQSKDLMATSLDIADIDLDGKLEFLIGTDNGNIIIIDTHNKEERKRIPVFSFSINQLKAINLDTTPQLEIIAIENKIKILDSKTNQTLWDVPDEYDDVFPNLYSIEAHDIDKNGYMELYLANVHGLFIFGVNQPVINKITALKELSSIPLICSPNPSSGELCLTFPSNEIDNGTIEVASTEGKLVFQQNIEKNQEKFDLNLSHLTNGLYLLKVKTIKGIAFHKVIISK